MKRNTSVHIKKVSEHTFTSESLDIGYEVEGTLLSDVIVGEALRIYREKTNGIEQSGIFTSSEVLDLEEDEDKNIVTTKNSTYEVIVLSPTEPENITKIDI